MVVIHRLLCATTLCFVAGVVAGCTAKPGERLADHIRTADSPLVCEVFFRDDWLDGPEVIISLRPGVTEAQAEQLWCEVIEPADGSHFVGDTATTVWDDSGWTPMALAADCDATSRSLSR
jgi:hypothetical protein